MMIMLMPSVFSGTYLMIIMMTSILYLMSLLLAFISNKITLMFDLDNMPRQGGGGDGAHQQVRRRGAN